MTKNQSSTRSGMTLVELLVVITIMTILIAVAIPVMRPSLKDRKLREASRMLNTFIAVAKARAIETGRPCGFSLERADITNNPDAAYQLFILETPLPYAGETYTGAGSLAKLPDVLAPDMSSPDGYATVVTFNDSYKLVKAGDMIQFGYKGPKYLITSAPADGEARTPGRYNLSPLDTTIPVNRRYPAANETGLPFQVFRSPIRSTTAPLTLPTGIVVDLGNSGFGVTEPTNPMGARPNAGQEFKRATDVTLPEQKDLSTDTAIGIMFYPSGAVERLYRRGYGESVSETIHLHIGRVEQVAALEPDAEKQNLQDPTTSWVSIGHQTGTVTTAEIVVRTDPSDTLYRTIRGAREIAQTKQTMGGR